MSLPLAFGTRLETIPGATPYLQASVEKRATWSARLGPRRRPRIGLVWSGSSDFGGVRERSIPLSDLLAALPAGLEYVSLQPGVRDADLPALEGSGIRRFDSELRDFADTAALCAELDLVLSIDTGVAHLAGAMGLPVWIQLLWVPDWRWGLEGESSPWYPAAWT
jgi:hypothetical protein